MNVAVVIDVFRAFATACYVLEPRPKAYILTHQSEVISRLREKGALLIGKPEIGANLEYDIPNSPTRVLGEEVEGRVVLHRTEAGSRGVLACDSDPIFCVGFCNADATVQELLQLGAESITLYPMGHEGMSPSLEDELCANYMRAQLLGEEIEIDFAPLKVGSGKYFFSEDQWQYPRVDFERCLELGRFNFAIEAKLRGDHALLVPFQGESFQSGKGDRERSRGFPSPSIEVVQGSLLTGLATPFE